MNGIFPPLSGATPAQLAAAASAALRGETHNIGRFTAPAGADSHALAHARIGLGKEIILTPRNAAAASVRWWIGSEGSGRAVIHFHPAPSAPAEFGFVVAGVGYIEGRLGRPDAA